MKLRYWTPDGPLVKKFYEKATNEVYWCGTEPFGLDDEELMRLFELWDREKGYEYAFCLLPLEVDK